MALRLVVVGCVWLSLLSACGAPTDPAGGIVYDPCQMLVLAPEPGTTQAELQSIAVAVELWRAVGLHSFTFDDLPGAARIPVLFKEAPTLFHGLYEPQTGRVIINRNIQDRMRDITTAHELGHALGLPHVEKAVRLSVMNPTNATIAPDERDEGALRERWRCPSVP